MAVKVGPAILALGLLAVGVYALTSNNDKGSDKGAGPTNTRSACVRKETVVAKPGRTRDDGKFWVTLRAWWEGCDDATISWSVADPATKNNNLPGSDYPCCYWEQSVLAGPNDLVLLHVTPTNGQGTTKCSINLYTKGGRPKEVTNENGGPVQCATRYT
jgi:hypothetical protein